MHTFLAIFFSFIFLVNPTDLSDKTVTVFEAVWIVDKNRAEAIYYYENNWKKLREKAMARGYIHSFEFILSEKNGEGPEIFLVTRFRDQKQLGDAEKNFAKLISERGKLRLLNELKPIQFRKRAFSIEGTSAINGDSEEPICPSSAKTKENL